MRVSACIMAVIAAWTHTVEAAVQQASFGTTRDGQAVEIYTLSNERGARARVPRGARGAGSRLQRALPGARYRAPVGTRA